MNKYFLPVFLILLTIDAASQTKMPADSLKGGDNRNMMLNAESASTPREINIGLPETGMGAQVYVDGVRHAQGMARSQYHWAGGNAYEPVSSINLMDAVITTGEVAVHVDSRTKLGRDLLKGDITFGTSSNGLLRLDAAVNGPIVKGWYFALGGYVNYDPTNVNAPSRAFVDQKQIYQFALTKRTSRTELSLMYRFSLCNDNVDGTYNKTPFIYNGDGSISTYGDFRIGRDCYFPADDAVKYMDISTGRYVQNHLGKMDKRISHDVTLLAKHSTRSGWQLEGNLHASILQPSQFIKVAISGVDNVTADQGFTLADGTPYSGNIQNRFVIIDDLYSYDFEASFKAERKFSAHKLRLGSSLVYVNHGESCSSVYFAHELTANPGRIYRGGENAWNYNMGGQYFSGDKYQLALYCIDDWNITDRWLARTGVRVAPHYKDLLAAHKNDTDEINKRVDGFNLADRSLSRLDPVRLFGVDYAVSEHMSYRIVDRLFVTAEGFYSKLGKATTIFKNAAMPSVKPVGTGMVSGGLMYDNKWLEATAVVTYIKSWDNAKAMSVSNQVGGKSETIPWTAHYGISTLGCTLDANLKFGGFKLHTLFTWQDPRYTDYSNEFVFSDGTTKVIDYTGKYVTGISQVMAELDPSYTWDRYRVWASVRYYSRQYASRTNYAYFNGHFESFAGFDMRFANSSKLSINFVNILFQNGVKGTLDIADTISDPSLLENYLMAGSYIRPFTVELSYTYRF